LPSVQYDLILTLYAAKRLKPTVKTLRMLAPPPKAIVCGYRQIAPRARRLIVCPTPSYC
jgi:hypothetical protein